MNSDVTVQPLGVFGDLFATSASRGALVPLKGLLADADRERVASYLENGSWLFAWLTFSDDVLRRPILGRRTAIPAGPALCSDGTYYWRYEAAYYVRKYGVGIPPQVLAHMEGQGWVPPRLSQETVSQLSAELERMRTISDPAACPG